MKEVDHLHALMVVEVAFVEVAAGGPDVLDGRLAGHVVVDALETAAAEVVDHLLHAALGFAKEDGVGMLHRLFGVQHGRYAPEEHLFASSAVFVRDGPSAFDLRAEHHRYGYEVARLVIVERFDILVRERHLDVLGQCGCKHDRPVWGQVESGLAL